VRHDRLQVCQNLGQHRIEWRLQRVAWPLLVLLLLAVMAGLLGQGPMAEASAHAPDGSLRLDYHRLVRRGAVQALQLRLQARGTQVALSLDGSYADRMDIEQVDPPPLLTRSANGITTYVFAALPGRELRAQLQVRPAHVGSTRAWLSLDDGPRVPFEQFAYP
jgi:hypothetical protein